MTSRTRDSGPEGETVSMDSQCHLSKKVDSDVGSQSRKRTETKRRSPYRKEDGKGKHKTVFFQCFSVRNLFQHLHPMVKK